MQVAGAGCGHLVATLVSMYLPIAMCATVAGLAAGGYQYAAMWPESHLFGPTLIAGRDSAEVAFTFDDGPNDPYTLQLLEVLDRLHTPATFFMIGDYVRKQPGVARAVRQAGHLIGSHTMTHPWLMYASRRRIRQEIADSTAMLQDTIGERVHFFRPPFGARRPDVLRTVRELELTPVMWNVSSADWKAPSVRAIEQNVERGIVHNQERGCGSNVLLHDGGHLQLGTDRRRTISAMATLLAMMPRAGMHPVTVDHWLPGGHAAALPSPQGNADA